MLWLTFGEYENDDAHTFCKEFHLNTQAAYYLRVFTEDGAFTMVRAWAHKMQWLYNKYIAEYPAHTFDLVGYVEPPYFQDYMDVAGDDRRITARIRQLRAILPRF